MQNNQTQNKKIRISLIVSFALHAASLVAIGLMLYSIQTLNTEATRLNKQALQFNGRTNNLEGCWKNQDYKCPENKYFDSSQFMND